MESIEKRKKKIQKTENRFAPCVEKNCSFCCDPVKTKRFFPENKIPVDENGEKIWKERPELLIPEDNIDTERLKAYDCINFDKTTNKCKNYEKRPDVCKKATCIDKNSKESIDEQHQKVITRKFITIKT